MRPTRPRWGQGVIARPLIIIGPNMPARSSASSNGKQRALAAEKIIASLLVLVGWYGQQIEALKGQLAWLKKQLFGRKSEASPANGLAASPEGASRIEWVGGAAEAHRRAPSRWRRGQRLPPQRRRGQQPGRPGPKRRRRGHLPEEITHHTLSAGRADLPDLRQGSARNGSDRGE